MARTAASILMESGYFKLQRRFFSHSLWEESREFSRAEAFLDLLQLAAYAHTKKIVKGVLVTLQPGELCGSERYLAGRWNWSTKKVRTFLALLEADEMIDVQKKREGSIIFLRNYGKYCDSENTEEAPKTHRGSTEEAPRKQIEEGKEGKEDSPPKPAKAVSAEGERFAEWFMTTLPPDTKPASNWKTSWAKTYDDLIRLDKRTKAEVFRVCTWARQDAFWASNFMSPAKLRARDKANVLYFDVFAQRSKQPAQQPAYSAPGLKPQVLANGEMFQPLFPGHRPDK